MPIHGWPTHFTSHPYASVMCYPVHRYMAANQRCKMAEDTIKYETKNVGQYSKMVEEKFKEVRTLH